MIDAKKEMLQNASMFWELGMLKNLLDRGFLSKKEYTEISKIIKKDYAKNNCV